MGTKILGLVRSCGQCPNYGYYSGGQHRCALEEKPVVDKSIVAPFCPLTDFPSKQLSNMDETIRALREPNKYGFAYALLSHVATKLKVTQGDYVTVPILLKNGERVYLSHDHIITIELPQWDILFVCGEKTYKLHPDSTPPTLYVQVKVDGIDELMWKKCELK